MASWQEAAAAPAPAPRRARPKPQTQPAPKSRPNGRARARAKQRARARAAILWILVSAVLLAGVVTVNLAVLRLNLSLDKATQERSKLRADNAGLQSQLSSALASPRIQAQARRQLGLVDADQASIGYLDLARKR